MNAIVAMVKRAFEPRPKSEMAARLESTLEWYERTTADLERAIDQMDTALLDLHPEREREHSED